MDNSFEIIKQHMTTKARVELDLAETRMLHRAMQVSPGVGLGEPDPAFMKLRSDLIEHLAFIENALIQAGA